VERGKLWWTVDDAYHADKQDDPDCLLCAEPLDLSDLNFRPCQCGLQASFPSLCTPREEKLIYRSVNSATTSS
jgi:hypothetical protein